MSNRAADAGQTEHTEYSEHSEQTLAEFWESKYADVERVWSGGVNSVLADTAAGLEPGNALDLACGEGADAVWLATRGWRVTGVDVSPTALVRGREAGVAAGIPEGQLQFEAADLETWESTQCFDLVTCSFLHTWPFEIPRGSILRRASGFVAPGGHMLITAHAEAPPWSDRRHTERHGHTFPTPESELRDLRLDLNRWEIVTAELRGRTARAPDGAPAHLLDSVVLVRRTT